MFFRMADYKLLFMGFVEIEWGLILIKSAAKLYNLPVVFELSHDSWPLAFTSDTILNLDQTVLFFADLGFVLFWKQTQLRT